MIKDLRVYVTSDKNIPRMLISVAMLIEGYKWMNISGMARKGIQAMVALDTRRIWKMWTVTEDPIQTSQLQ